LRENLYFGIGIINYSDVMMLVLIFFIEGTASIEFGNYIFFFALIRNYKLQNGTAK
jgi:hypothetical protein